MTDFNQPAALLVLAFLLGSLVGVLMHRVYIRRLIRLSWTGHPQSLLAQITQDRAEDSEALKKVQRDLADIAAQVGGQATEVKRILAAIDKSMEGAETLRTQFRFSASKSTGESAGVRTSVPQT